MSFDAYGMDKFSEANDKLISGDLDDKKHTQLLNWQNFNPGITSMRLLSPEES